MSATYIPNNHFKTPNNSDSKNNDKKPILIPELKLSGLSIINTSPYKSPKSPTFTSCVFKDLPVKPISCSMLNTYMDKIIIDVRCFNRYSTSRIRNSIHICLPFTLLKRQSYGLPQILDFLKVNDTIKNALLNPGNDTEVLFYDEPSDPDVISFQLFQTTIKFLNYNGKFNISYLNRGFDIDQIDAALIDTNPLKSFVAPLSPVDNGIPTVLSGFQLPKSTPSREKFLSSIRTVPKLDISSIQDNKTPSHHDYKLHFTDSMLKTVDKIPLWLQRIFINNENGVRFNSDSVIVDVFDHKFNKIEVDEQLRLQLAINGDTNNKDVCICTPTTPCPSCDDIVYEIPKGIELGWKNRYNNIFPFEHSRVRLIKDSSANKFEDDDYFNGNFITAEKISSRQYLATQNPLNSTFYDFWNSVWFNEIHLIICLNDQNQMETRYFDDQTLNDDICVKLQQLEQYSDYNLRILKLSKFSTGSETIVYHLEFKHMPDFGVPTSKTIIDLINFKNDLVKSKGLNNKVLVHCLAGCGRTGTFITIDMIMDLLNNKDDSKYNAYGETDLVYKSIQSQRRQRMSMVQNFDQFVFCYETLFEYFVNV